MSQIKEHFRDQIEALPQPREGMSPNDFIDFLARICDEQAKVDVSRLPLFSDEKAKVEAYKEIGSYIRLYRSGDYMHG